MLLAPFGIVPETLRRATRAQLDVRGYDNGIRIYDQYIFRVIKTNMLIMITYIILVRMVCYQ